MDIDVKKRWADETAFAGSGIPAITDPYKRHTTAVLLENTNQSIRQEMTASGGQYRGMSMLTEAPIPVNAMAASSSDPTTGAIDTYDPVLIAMVRRAAPNMLAYDLVGVQPMTAPTGLIFAMRSRYTNQSGAETFYNEVNTAFSSILSGANTFGQKHVGTLPGNSTAAGNLASTGVYNTGTGMPRSQLEALGTDSNSDFAQMSMSIEKISVTAQGRALAAEYTMELAQDLKTVHGLDAESELANILTTEILTEINRELIRTINYTAQIGCQENTTTPGFFDLDQDANGRWSVEKWKGLHFQIERECNQIAKNTRRGKGNMAVMTSDTAAALIAAGVLDYAPALQAMQNMVVDDTGNTFAGILGGRIRCYIDPYATGGQYVTVGYKGPTPYDAGLFYCPYVPLQMVRAVRPDSFTPRIGFKTRYGIVANPYAEGLTAGVGVVNKDSNVYYRKFLISNLM